jgi:hypothetical protein
VCGKSPPLASAAFDNNVMVAMPRRSTRSDCDLILAEHEAHDRVAVSRFIRASFLRDHGARLTQLMPRLFSLSTPEGEMVAAFGLREAAEERLFMECYLDEPVEARIARLTGREVARERVIEVGNLAARPGGARSMIARLTRHLHALDFEWVTFTGVARLRSAFLRLGLQPLEIARATADRLSEAERAAWGRYFESRPIVMAGHVPSGYRVLCRARRHLAAAIPAEARAP